ncbi:DUF4494 domain-containing protein [Bacteroidota bacterium]
MWYECKIKYSRIDEDDRTKTFNQPYLFDAMSFTEAEARVTEEMKQYISTEFRITNIKVANFAEICPNENGDRWFKCKLSCITLDEEKGTERRSNSYILVQANDVKDAYDVLSASLTDTISNFEIPSVTESPILDVFPYFSGEEEAPLNDEVPENFSPLETEDEIELEEVE